MTGRLADSTQALDREEQPFRALNLDLNDPRDRRFADYELIERIGGGGMGVVYRARQISLEREVALKIFAYDPFAVDDMLARFRSEARHAGRLQHPNIVPVFEIGTHENLHFFSMGLVRGPTLGQWLRSEKRPLRELVRLMRTVAEAVEYAHQVGILHLDLKPGNVLIDERGAPQVGDFGLAHRISEAAEGRVMAAGTPAYMAPEQAVRNARLSIRTDVWGLGAILFEMLTGEPPFVGQNNAETLRRLLNHPLDPPRLRNPAVPADLDAICRRCLAKDPAERYASARELADDLQRYIDGRPVSVRTPGWPERLALWARREPRAAALTGGLAITLLLGLAMSVALWRQAENHRAAAQATLFEARRQSAHDAQARGDALAAIPALVANIDEAERSRSRSDVDLDRLRLGALLSRSPRQIAQLDGGGEGRSVAFAEDGKLLLVSLRNGELAALSLDGKERWRITPPFPPTAWANSFAGRMQATPDGMFAVLHSSGSSGIARPDVSAMQRVALADGTLATPPVTTQAQSFAADGRHALLKTQAGWQRWRVDPWSTEGAVFASASRYCHLTIRGLAACAEQGFKRVAMIDAISGATLARIELPSGGEIGAWLPSDDGVWLAIGGTAGDVLLVDLDTFKTSALNADDAINDFAFAGDVLGVSGSRGSARLLSIGSKRWLTRALASGGDRMNSVIVDPGGWLIGNDGRIVVWPFAADSDEFTEPLAIVRHRGALIGMNAVALHAPSGLLASYGSEGDILLTRLPQPALSLAHRLPGEGERPAPDVRVDGKVVSLNTGNWALPSPPYRIERSAGGAVLMAAGRALFIDRGGERRTLELPHSAQTLAIHPVLELALVGWIEVEGPLTMSWRVLDLSSGEWRSPPIAHQGLVGGVRFGADRWALWQGPTLLVFAMDGSALGTITIGNSALRITDVALDGDRVLIATAATSRLQPGTLEQWRIGTPPQLLRQIATPSAHDRVFDFGDRWLGTGARVAVYVGDSRRELTEFGSDWSEAAAVSADGRLAAFATRAAVHVYALETLSPLLAPLSLPLARNDAIAALAFADNALIVMSHYGVRHQIALEPDRRELEALRAEAFDALPSRDAVPAYANRAARDSGMPQPLPGVTAQATPVAPFNVAQGQRFQGSSRGLGITDSAGWPRGRLRLRGVDVELGSALQLAPAGTALGAAVFPAEALLDAPGGERVHLFLGNQMNGDPAFAVDFLDAAGRTLASEVVSLPSSWDGAIHDRERGHLPRADVALIVRTAESRERGGGSPQLFIYHVSLDQSAGATKLRLRALRGAPLILGVAAD